MKKILFGLLAGAGDDHVELQRQRALAAAAAEGGAAAAALTPQVRQRERGYGSLRMRSLRYLLGNGVEKR